MADFDPPFADSGEHRLPTPGEVASGFECGPADRSLFNGLFRRLESELGNLMTHAGIVHTDDNYTGVKDAVLALIAAATGGGTAEDYILMAQARTRLPIYPEILNVDGRIGMTSPGVGTVRVPGGVDFLHRGIYPVTTAQTDLLTDPSKIYHCRWNSVDGFTLKDLANVGYNPSSLVETNSGFDSTYDDMLIARIVTTAGNVATITNLSNKDRLSYEELLTLTGIVNSDGQSAYGTLISTFDWARTPKNKNLDTLKIQSGTVTVNDNDMILFPVTETPPGVTTTFPVDRYKFNARWLHDYMNGAQFHFSVSA